MTHLRIALLAALAAGAAARGDDPAPGHSAHGEAFDDGPRQKAVLLGGTGKVHLPITGASEEAQAFFDQGVGQLHGFWYFEAERSFRQVAALKPDCAMAYWGMAMANVNTKDRAAKFIKVAADKKDKVSPREQKWITAYADYWLGKGDDKTRRQELAKALEELALDFPDELEAKAFLAVQLWDSSQKGVPLPSKLTVDTLIRDVLAKEPAHPAHHYMIHLWDGPKAARALPSAAMCGQAAPTIAHMWHMPGHTYVKTKRYADAAWQQEASARSDHRAMIRDRVLPDQIHNYAHNNQWLSENLQFVGRAHDAVAVAANLIELPRHPKYNTLALKADGANPEKKGSSAEGRKRLIEALTRYELWDELIALSGTVYLEPTDLPAEQVKRLRALGLAYFGTGNAAKGREQIAALEDRVAKFRADRYAAADEAEAKAKAEKKPAADVTKAMAEAMQKLPDRRPPVEAALTELRGLDALARGDKPAARRLLYAAADIPKDRLARYALAVGDEGWAERLARDDVAANPNQVARLANLVDVLARCGKTKDAAAEFQKLRDMAAEADLDVPVMKRLAPLAAELKFPADWRNPRKPATDVGVRPPLADLGPLAWEPWAAPDWRLPAVAGGQKGLADYRGKPVVVVAFLGFGCVHCVEQLKAFAPLKQKYRDAGIEVVAIGTDAPPEGEEAVTVDGAAAVPFPVLADPDLSFFKAYRAYDDFEGRPLHGTFLIDPAGRVRWQDIGPEPFKDATFLLGEAKRLLAVPDRRP